MRYYLRRRDFGDVTVPGGSDIGSGTTSWASVAGFAIVGFVVFRYLLGGSR